MNKALEISIKAILGVRPFRNLSKSRLEQARANTIKAEFLGSGFLPRNKNEIRNIKLPTLPISGEESPKLWQHLLLELHTLVSNSELKTIPNASHIMHEDNVSDYKATLLAFLEKNSN